MKEKVNITITLTIKMREDLMKLAQMTHFNTLNEFIRHILASHIDIVNEKYVD